MYNVPAGSADGVYNSAYRRLTITGGDKGFVVILDLTWFVAHSLLDELYRPMNCDQLSGMNGPVTRCAFPHLAWAHSIVRVHSRRLSRVLVNNCIDFGCAGPSPAELSCHSLRSLLASFRRTLKPGANHRFEQALLWGLARHAHCDWWVCIWAGAWDETRDIARFQSSVADDTGAQGNL